MGDLLSKEMLADLIINIVNILVLFFVTKKLLYKPVKKYLDARKEKVAASFTEAEAMKAEAAAAKEKYDAVIAEADAEKEKTVREAKADAVKQAEKIISDAKAQADELVEDAKAKAKKEHDKAISDSKNDIADIAVQISEKIIGRSVTDEDNKNIINSFFGE